jgi:hypothetical protein
MKTLKQLLATIDVSSHWRVVTVAQIPATKNVAQHQHALKWCESLYFITFATLLHLAIFKISLSL